MKPKVVIVDPHLPFLHEELALLAGYADVLVTEWSGRDDLVAVARDACVLMIDGISIDAQMLRELGCLQAVIQYGVGVDHIDVAAATELGIAVCNVPEAYPTEVAEHTLALILAVSRDLLGAHRMVAERGVWNASAVRAVKLEGKVAGVIGFGRIGSRVAQRLKGLGLEVQVYDPYVPPVRVEMAGHRPVALDELLRTSDIITLHTPVTEETRSLLGRAEFESMKDGVILVNTARGRLIDEEALLDALNKQKVRGAGLDVLVDEPPPPDHPLLRHPNVVVTPHMGWCSEHAAREVELGAAVQARDVVQGRVPAWVVNQEVLPHWRGHKRA